MISIIIPTKGRFTLKRTLLSIRPAKTPVEVLVISDGKQPVSKAIVKEIKNLVGYDLKFIEGPKTNRWGNAQRNIGMEQANGNWLMFIDDDDIYTPDAFKAIDKAIEQYPNQPLVFRMLDHNGDRYILWRKRRNILGNVGTPMVCLPNNINRLAEWPDTDDYGSDAHFIYNTLRKYPKKKIAWIKDCIIICRPEK